MNFAPFLFAYAKIFVCGYFWPFRVGFRVLWTGFEYFVEVFVKAKFG